jgi:hypothetical protein
MARADRYQRLETARQARRAGGSRNCRTRSSKGAVDQRRCSGRVTGVGLALGGASIRRGIEGCWMGCDGVSGGVADEAERATSAALNLDSRLAGVNSTFLSLAHS